MGETGHTRDSMVTRYLAYGSFREWETSSSALNMHITNQARFQTCSCPSRYKHSVIPGSKQQWEDRGIAPASTGRGDGPLAAPPFSKSRANLGGLWKSCIPWMNRWRMLWGIMIVSKHCHASLPTELSDPYAFWRCGGLLLNEAAARHFQACDNLGNHKDINCLPVE